MCPPKEDLSSVPHFNGHDLRFFFCQTHCNLGVNEFRVEMLHILFLK